MVAFLGRTEQIRERVPFPARHCIEEITADGGDDGKGKLVGILFQDYRLSEPFELGASGEWESPSDSNLFLRCRDDWSSIGDNGGSVTVKFKVAE